MMKRLFIIILISLGMYSCATGPVYKAQNEQDAFKTTYEDQALARLYMENDKSFRAIYSRFKDAGVDFYKEGLGITVLRDENGERLPYLMVNIRPKEVYFDANTTVAQDRFSYVIKESLPKYLRFFKKEDLQNKDIKGLAIGIFWPVRDFTQCNEYGGFLEYLNAYISKEDLFNFLDEKKAYVDVIQESEVMVSVDLKPAKNIRPVF